MTNHMLMCGVRMISSISLNELQAVLTSIVLKQNVTMLDIVSTRMLGQVGFLAKVRKFL